MYRLPYLLVLLLFFAPLLAGCQLDGHSLRLEEGEEQQELAPGPDDPEANDQEEGENLLEAAKNGHLARVEQLLAQGADPNLQGTGGFYKGKTALMNAVWRGHTGMVKLLLQGGADPNLKEKDGMTALMYAAQGGHTEMVQALLAGGADPNLQAKYGQTALMYAAQGGHTEIVQLLLERGADPNLKNAWGKTALMRAAREGDTGIVKVLLKRGANPNLQDRDGQTALMYALQHAAGNIPLFKLLIDTPQDLSLANNQGQTALDIAEMKFQTTTNVNDKQFYSFAIAQLKKKRY